MLTKEASYYGRAIGRSVLRCFALLSVFALGTAVPQLAIAQIKSAEPPVYTYVEQMPELLGGGGQAAIVAAVMKSMQLPATVDDGNMRYSGIHFTFIVNADGSIRNEAMVTSSNNRSVDQAILDAVHQLPKFRPGQQRGQPVPVRLTFAISCIKVQ
jgi:TonB family protein